MPNVKTYDPKKINVIIGGYFMSGFAEGKLVTVKRSVEAFTKLVGSTGEVARSKSANMTGEVEISLLSTSLSNNTLTELATLDEVNGGGILPLLIQDKNGTTLVSAKSCWVRKKADVEFAKDAASERVWTLDTDDMLFVVGGTEGV